MRTFEARNATRWKQSSGHSLYLLAAWAVHVSVGSWLADRGELGQPWNQQSFPWIRSHGISFKQSAHSCPFKSKVQGPPPDFKRFRFTGINQCIDQLNIVRKNFQEKKLNIFPRYCRNKKHFYHGPEGENVQLLFLLFDLVQFVRRPLELGASLV